MSKVILNNDFSAYNTGEYIVFNNVWGKGSLSSGSDFYQSLTFNTQSPTNGMLLEWNWPVNKSGTIVAYPEIIIGDSPYYDGADENHGYVSAISNLKTLAVDLAVTPSAGSQYVNIAFDIFLTSMPLGDASTITTEVMIWLDSSSVPWGTTNVGKYIDGAHTANIYFYEGGKNADYIAVAFDKPWLDADLDLKSIFDDLVVKGLISASDYFGGIQFGAEISGGSGSLVIDHFSTSFERYSASEPRPINGTAGNDVLVGTNGNDIINAGAGNDIIEGGAGADVLDGGAGIDTLQYKTSNQGVTVNLATNTATGGHATGDVISNFENVTGSEFADTLTGNAANNTILGLGGNDIIEGGAGADVLDGGAGIDTLQYKTSNQGVTVNLATSTATGGHATGDVISNFENVTGSEFADTLTGNAANNTILGLGGNDIIEGGAGADVLDGGAGIDTLQYKTSNQGVTVNLATNTATGGHATGDVISNFENVTGSEFADTLTGDAKDNIIWGLGGSNVIDGGDGSDILYAGNNADKLMGGAGNDQLYGGAGWDRMIGGLGADKFWGGAGGDWYVYTSVAESTLTAMDHIFDFKQAEGDRIELAGLDANSNTSGHQTFKFIGSSNFSGSAGELMFSATATDTYIYADVDGDKKADLAIHLQGHHDITASSFRFSYTADGLLPVAPVLAETPSNGAHISVSNQFNGSQLGDTLTGTAKADLIYGLGGNDVIDGGAGDDIIYGGDGSDKLMGGAGNDQLIGGDGWDRMIGGLGADKFWGGTGGDWYVFTSVAESAPTAMDQIFDFNYAEGDRIELAGLDANSKTSGHQMFKFVGSNNFSGSAGELRVATTANDTYVYADVDGDAQADLAIHLHGHFNLTADAFRITY